MKDYYGNKDDFIEYPKAYHEGLLLGKYGKNPYAIGSGPYYDFNRGVKDNSNLIQKNKSDE
jgi:hypothetical protein